MEEPLKKQVKKKGTITVSINLESFHWVNHFQKQVRSKFGKFPLGQSLSEAGEELMRGISKASQKEIKWKHQQKKHARPHLGNLGSKTEVVKQSIAIGLCLFVGRNRENMVVD